VLDVKTSPEAKYLNVCKGRTNQLFCASGNVTEMQMMDDTVRQTLRSYAEGKYSSERAARELSTVVDISIPPPSFKPVLLSSPRSPLSKTPKHVIF
jgi:hypothetical protein